ncbi:MAG: prolipoprotein diacylglyceryl transferase [Leptospiraceae bacterium]|nr:prolipoprotein diacylglyceryl transferase [Leptospiraceae bacterium]MCP5501215.1 prolipoprotein diacylglyceryl transferase [Leptospiraceae bacterium]
MIDKIPIPNPFGWGGISTFSILLLIAFFTGSYLLPREYKRRGLKPEVADMVVFLGVLGTLVGAKVFFIFEIWDQIFVRIPGYSLFYPLTHWDGLPNQPGLWSSLFSGGGLVFYGGFIVGALFILLYFKKHSLPLAPYFDGMAPTMAIGYAIGRLGCFVSGDGCYGHYTDANIPILVFTFQGAHPSYVPVWNTPIMESFLSFLFFFYFQFYARYQNFKSYSLFFQYLFLHGTARLCIEFLRVNKAVIPFRNPPEMVNIPPSSQNEEFLKSYYWHGFSQSQYISLLLMLVSVFFILQLKLWKKEEAQSS